MLLLNMEVTGTTLQGEGQPAPSLCLLQALSFERGCQDAVQSPSAPEAQEASLNCSQALQGAGI